MDAMDALCSRRSIRRYTADPVPDSTLEEILRAAMQAPSAGNEQPWQFVVITDRGILQEVSRFHPHAAMAQDAPVAILVCGDLKREKHKGFWVQDCSAATQNLLLAAHANGLGAVWVGIFPREDRVAGFRALCDLPVHIVPLALVPLGFPAAAKPRDERFDPARIHRNRWGAGARDGPGDP